MRICIFNIGITDYWFSQGQDESARYFKYRAHSTNHVFEANIGFDFGPLAFQWFTNFGGNDGFNKDSLRAYSSYFEISVPFTLASLDWNATLGAVPYATDFYSTTSFAITNLAVRAIKNVQLTDSFCLPIFAEISANPYADHAYIVVGLTLQP